MDIESIENLHESVICTISTTKDTTKDATNIQKHKNINNDPLTSNLERITREYLEFCRRIQEIGVE